MTRTLGSLLSGGVPLLGALEITKGVVNNTEYKLVLDSAIEECAEGASLAESLKREGRVPSMVLHMISVGEKSGSLDSMLVKTAESYEEQFSNGLKRAIALIEPLMLLAMGLIVGLIVLAILLPIFELKQIVR
jgi:general secretion pathway protein F